MRKQFWEGAAAVTNQGKAGPSRRPSGQATIRPGAIRQLLDQFDHLEALPRREPEKRLQETNGFDCFARRSSQFLTQFRN